MPVKSWLAWGKPTFLLISPKGDVCLDSSLPGLNMTEILTYFCTVKNRTNLLWNKPLSIRASLTLETEKVKGKQRNKQNPMLFEMFWQWAQTFTVPLHAEMRMQQGMKLNGQGAVGLHRGAQDLQCEKEMERQSFQKKKKKLKDKCMKKLDQTPTSLVQLCEPPKQLPLCGYELENRSWERIKPGGNADERGISAM